MKPDSDGWLKLTGGSLVVGVYAPDRDPITVLVGTFGDEMWADLAYATAIPSALAQHPSVNIVAEHAARLDLARNLAAARASGWMCFLDADDELEPGYIAAMVAAIQSTPDAERCLFAPNIRFVRDGIPGDVESIAHRDIDTINPCVIGTLIHREMFDQAGGFWNEPAWEDWSLFRRCWLLGADIVHVPDAVYRIHVNPTGRNSTIPNSQRLHKHIIRTHNVWMRSRQP